MDAVRSARVGGHYGFSPQGAISIASTESPLVDVALWRIKPTQLSQNLFEQATIR
jgi:hypothetical protein